MRIILLFAVTSAIKYFQTPFFEPNWTDVFEGAFNVHSVIVLAGGAFIIYTAMKEIYHMLAVEHLESESGAQRSIGSAIFWR